MLTDMLSVTTGQTSCALLASVKRTVQIAHSIESRKVWTPVFQGCMPCECVHSGVNVQLYIMYIVPDVILALEEALALGPTDSTSMRKATLLVSFRGKGVLRRLPPQLQVLYNYGTSF